VHAPDELPNQYSNHSTTEKTGDHCDAADPDISRNQLVPIVRRLGHQ
jgi:hypothetical protein